MTMRDFAVALVILAAPSLARAETQHFSVIFGGKNVGHLTADTVPPKP
jgi:hypothetical protein